MRLGFRSRRARGGLCWGEKVLVGYIWVVRVGRSLPPCSFKIPRGIWRLGLSRFMFWWLLEIVVFVDFGEKGVKQKLLVQPHEKCNVTEVTRQMQYNAMQYKLELLNKSANYTHSVTGAGLDRGRRRPVGALVDEVTPLIVSITQHDSTQTLVTPRDRKRDRLDTANRCRVRGPVACLRSERVGAVNDHQETKANRMGDQNSMSHSSSLSDL